MARNVKMELLTFSLILYQSKKLWTQNTRIIHDVWRLLILSNEEKRMIMKILKKNDLYDNFQKQRGGSREKGGGGNEIHAPCACETDWDRWIQWHACVHFVFRSSGSIASVWSTFAKPLSFKSTLIVSILNRGSLIMSISTELLTEMSRQT